jgi:hypothetical protein
MAAVSRHSCGEREACERLACLARRSPRPVAELRRATPAPEIPSPRRNAHRLRRLAAWEVPVKGWGNAEQFPRSARTGHDLVLRPCLKLGLLRTARGAAIWLWHRRICSDIALPNFALSQPVHTAVRRCKRLWLQFEDLLRVPGERLPSAAILRISAKFLVSKASVRALEYVDAVIAVLILERSQNFGFHRHFAQHAALLPMGCDALQCRDAKGGPIDSHVRPHS